MAIVRNNPITKGLSGMLGQTLVFKNILQLPNAYTAAIAEHMNMR